ncbi:sugar transferase [Variovorax sp. LT1R16]|uniref:sugar transferase n=1 Tax=Variovorax sp. LT1R16 TaxID=3443728 RepID=UPI003F472354
MNFSHTSLKAPVVPNRQPRNLDNLTTPLQAALPGGRESGAEDRRFCPSPWQRVIKRSLDVVGALMFFIFLGPVYLCIALAVRLRMGGPVHYSQQRLGHGGRAFRFYKFRSMCVDSDEMLARHLASDPAAQLQWRRYQKLDNDPRITPLGHFLRRASLDELPQFWNVLKGDMSLVGPRPCMERQRNLYGRHWERYCDMRPGITGLWQVSGRNRLTYAQRVELDMVYASEWSLWLDIQIIASTFRVVLRHEGPA